MIRLIQLHHPQQGRRVARVENSNLLLLSSWTSVYELALATIQADRTLADQLEGTEFSGTLDYEAVYEGVSDWSILPAFDHPYDVNACLVSGTGLTHRASAHHRQIMHDADARGTLTDSMKMYQLGEEGGRPAAGQVGAQPEWFYKGNGSVLRGHGEALEVPPYAEDGGEEPEVAGAYLIDAQGTPYRIGLATGNEFSDHVMEKQNYLYLAPSKIRTCALGPELAATDTFKTLTGTVRILREHQLVWQREVATGESTMAHSLANLEYHHFKYANHRVPGQAHVHFYGADAFSFGEGIKLTDGDLMEVSWPDLGRALRNPVHIDSSPAQCFAVKGL